MNKFKKILLAFAPLGAIAIATPVALTACSTTTGSTNKEFAPFVKDDTNDLKFGFAETSEAGKILKQYEAAADQAAATKVLTDSLNGFPKKGNDPLITDVLNMWSNNNWIKIKKTATDEKVKETFISKINVTKASVAENSTASFDIQYQNAFVDKNGRTFEATQLIKQENITVSADTPSVDINKTVSNYKIDGQDQSLTPSNPPASLFDTTTPSENDIAKTNFEKFLNLPKITLNAKTVFEEYIKNHEINFGQTTPPSTSATAPIWNQTEVGKDNKLQYTSQTEIALQLETTANANWDNVVTTMSYEQVKTAMQKDAIATKIKALITSNDYENPTLEYGAEVKNTNDSEMHITIKFTKKADASGTDAKPTLTFKVKGFKKTTA